MDHGNKEPLDKPFTLEEAFFLKEKEKEKENVYEHFSTINENSTTIL
jgi:hypothetical protein